MPLITPRLPVFAAALALPILAAAPAYATIEEVEFINTCKAALTTTIFYNPTPLPGAANYVLANALVILPGHRGILIYNSGAETVTHNTTQPLYAHFSPSPTMYEVKWPSNLESFTRQTVLGPQVVRSVPFTMGPGGRPVVRISCKLKNK